MHDIRITPDDLLALWPDYRPTPLLRCPNLASFAGVGEVMLKVEGERPLGNFKALGGLLGALLILSREGGHLSVADLLAASPGQRMPALICASDGNHGLAVATAAKRVGATARILLPSNVAVTRIARIVAAGARPIIVDGTYDDAVERARAMASAGEGLLVPDTSDREDDPVVAAVMSGYDIMVTEIIEQLGTDYLPSHMFVQAGVGGLAAALTVLPVSAAARRPHIVVVEPASAACVAAALQAGHPVKVEGNLGTCAAMLSCGEASAPALRLLREAGAGAIQVSEEQLWQAPTLLHRRAGIMTTPSGAAGLAGLLHAAADQEVRTKLRLTPESRVLLIVTEGPVG